VSQRTHECEKDFEDLSTSPARFDGQRLLFAGWVAKSRWWQLNSRGSIRWPQSPDVEQVELVTEGGVRYVGCAARHSKNKGGLRALYRTLRSTPPNDSDSNPLPATERTPQTLSCENPVSHPFCRGHGAIRRALGTIRAIDFPRTAPNSSSQPQQTRIGQFCGNPGVATTGSLPTPSAHEPRHVWEG